MRVVQTIPKIYRPAAPGVSNRTATKTSYYRAKVTYKADLKHSCQAWSPEAAIDNKLPLLGQARSHFPWGLTQSCPWGQASKLARSPI